MANIKNLRMQAGLSKIGLAKMAKISRQYLAEIENNNAIPSVVIANRLAQALCCSIEKLDIKGTNKKPPDKSG